jgi:hypothetical protein
VSTRGDFKRSWNSFGCIGLIWLFGLGAVVAPFVASNNGFATAVGVILGIAWTVLAVWVFSKWGSPSYWEKARWQRQEQTRLRKKAWTVGRSRPGPTSSRRSPSALLPPTSMHADVPKELAELRSRFQAELEATKALPDERSRLQAELDVRRRFDAELKARLEGRHDPSV